MHANKTTQNRETEQLPLRSSWIQDQGWCVWLIHDPRSVSAMLRGCGDGREKLYDKYVRYWRKRNAALSEESLHAGYEEYALYMDRFAQQELKGPLQTTWEKWLLSERMAARNRQLRNWIVHRCDFRSLLPNILLWLTQRLFVACCATIMFVWITRA